MAGAETLASPEVTGARILGQTVCGEQCKREAAVTRLSDLVREQHKKMGPAPGATSAMSGSGASGGTSAAASPLSGAGRTGPDWYRLGEQELERQVQATRQQAPMRMEQLTQIAAGLVSSLAESDGLVVDALSCRSSSPVISNSVNVAILATKIAMGLHYEPLALERVALAGLVHDVGMFTLPDQLVMKAGQLTPEDRALVRRHPQQGFEILDRLGSSYAWLAKVALHEHERWAGQGYPHRVKGAEIDEYAQLIGLADVFDALVSPRPYHRQLSAHDAVRELLVKEKHSFAHHLLKVLVEQLSMYPLGTTVRLNTGAIGTVVQLNQRYPLRPIVQIAPGCGPDAMSTQMDLSQTTGIHIVEVVKTLVAA